MASLFSLLSFATFRADHMTEDDKWKFAFIPEFADCVARVASVWREEALTARLEYDVSVAISLRNTVFNG
jgi:hypothetical protein